MNPLPTSASSGPRVSACVVHSERDAVARCPGCSQSYCRECVTEHDGRYLCAMCLRKLQPVIEQSIRDYGWLVRGMHLTLGVLLTWSLFYLTGRLLLQIPSDWHEGTVVERLVD